MEKLNEQQSLLAGEIKARGIPVSYVRQGHYGFGYLMPDKAVYGSDGNGVYHRMDAEEVIQDRGKAFYEYMVKKGFLKNKVLGET